MGKSLLYALIAVLVFNSQPSRADWQGTQWGQTIEEVVEANPNLERFYDDQNVLAGLDFELAGATAYSDLWFDHGLLTKVTTWFYRNPDFTELMSIITDRYGTADQIDVRNGDAYYFWRVEDEHNNVRLNIPAEGTISVVYTPILDADSGL